MNLSKPFITHPVMTTLLTVGLVVFGVMAYFSLPVSDLPAIEFPVITVRASNPGMDPNMMANNVASPIEKQLMAIPGLSEIVSSSNYGNTTIVCRFDLDKNIDVASTDVAAAINNASGDLPPEMPAPPSYKKVNPSDAPVMYVAVSSESMTLGKLYDYGNTIVSQRLSMLPGVSQIQVYGSKSNVRIKVNPDKLAAMDLGIDEVAEAVVNANQTLPSGTVYDQWISYTLNPQGQLESGESYEKIILAERENKPIYLTNVAVGVDSTHDEEYFLRYWTRERGEVPTVVVAVTKQTGANTVKLCEDLRAMLLEIKKEIPQSITLDVIFDRSVSIKESINDVQFTLLLAFLLVVLVIFLFIGEVRSTIIPAISLPVTIFGAFLVMAVLGYSMDILSMLGLTLVIGFLVDDAIVVLENIVRHTEMGKDPRKAALDGSSQISTTVLSMTLSLSAVFIPLIFMPGVIGRLFHEMAVVVVAAVLLSGVVSLTLTPMLCSKFLTRREKKNSLEQMADRIIGQLLVWYERPLRYVMQNRKVPIFLGIGSVFLATFLFQVIPMDFLPPGDTGGIQGLTIAGEEVSLKNMASHQEEVLNRLNKNSAVKNVLAIANIPEFTPSNQGIIFVTLKGDDERPPISEVVKELNKSLEGTIGIETFLRPIPQINLNIGTGVERADYSYVLYGATDPERLYRVAGEMARQLKGMAELKDVSVDVQMNSPWLKIDFDRDQASSFGISIKTIEQAFQYGYSGSRISTYKTPLDVYDIVVQMEDEDRLNPDALNKIYLRSGEKENQGQLIPLNTVASWEETVGPLQVNHNSQLPAATIYFNLAEGKSLSDAVAKVTEVADQTLPSEIIRTFQGQAAVFKQTASQMGPLLFVGIFIIYLLLGSLYENFFHPLTIISTLPGALFGGLFTLLIFGASLSLYAFVGMIVLIGIVLKNGIMLVEFANEAVLDGKEKMEAVIEACCVRFRPILMTTIAASMGALPIALGIGADAASRRPMGLIILGGLLFAQLITYFFTPVVCYYSLKEPVDN